MNLHRAQIPPVKASMGEGNTPLIEAVHLGHTLGGGKLFFKLESCNPTGSYKDRFIAAEVTRMLNCGAGACVATSSGNTGSSLAAYCARYDIRCLILVNEDAPSGKLIQMQAHGAKVVRIPEFVSNAEVTSSVFETLQRFSEDNHVPLIVSAFLYCPEGMRGVETIASGTFACRRISGSCFCSGRRRRIIFGNRARLPGCRKNAAPRARCPTGGMPHRGRKLSSRRSQNPKRSKHDEG